MNIFFLLDLVDEPRVSKIGIPKNLRKYKHIPKELSELVQQIYVRLDERTGYAKYTQLWSQFVQYSQGMIPEQLLKHLRAEQVHHRLIYQINYAILKIL